MTLMHAAQAINEELEAIVQHTNYDLVAITEMWWHSMTGVLQWIAISCSEGTGKEGGKETLSSTSGKKHGLKKGHE